MIDKQVYATRITNASQSKLLLINFELVIDYINESKLYLQAEKENKSEDKYEFMHNIKVARNFLNELISSLDMQYKISQELLEVYKYVDKKILKYLYTEDISFADEGIKILSIIQEGFIELDKKEVDNTPIMNNTEAIYSGLTYNRNMTHTEYVNPSISRGFQA